MSGPPVRVSFRLLCRGRGGVDLTDGAGLEAPLVTAS